MLRSVFLSVLLAGLLGSGPAAVAQSRVGNLSSGDEGAPHSIVVKPSAHVHEPLGVGDVGAELLSAPAARAYRASIGSSSSATAVMPQDEVSTAEFKRGAIIGGGAGAAGGALIGALLGGGRNSRVEVAIPGALAGLAVGTPVGVYLQTDRSPRYLWGAAGVVGAAAAGTAIYFAE